MKSGIILEEISKDELLAHFMALSTRISGLEERICANIQETVTLSELSRVKGYSKAQLRRMITRKSIPFEYDGKELVINRKDAGAIRVKKSQASF